MALPCHHLGHCGDPQVIESLHGLFADAVVFGFKAKSFSWNAIDKNFESLSSLCQTMSYGADEHVSKLANRLRALDEPVMANLKTVLQKAEIFEADPPAIDCLQRLTVDLERISQKLEKGAALARERKDLATADFLLELLRAHQTLTWRIKAHQPAPAEGTTKEVSSARGAPTGIKA